MFTLNKVCVSRSHWSSRPCSMAACRCRRCGAWLGGKGLVAGIFAKVERCSRSLDSEEIFAPYGIVMQGCRLFTSPPEQHIGKSDKMRDGAIDRGAIYLVTGAHRSHFNNGDNHSGIWTFVQPAVKVGQERLFLIAVSHDKTPPARPAENRWVSYSRLLEGPGVKSASTSARPIAATDQPKLGTSC